MSDLQDTGTPALSSEAVDKRITFHDDDQIMEVLFNDLHFHSQKDVNIFYDRIEERIEATGEDKWFFLVNYSGARFETDAWFAFHRRGKALNAAHSMGSVRVDASDETRRQIEQAAGTDAFDPNLFADRAAAYQHLRTLPSQRVVRVIREPNYTQADFAKRITFLDDDQIMDVDFSDFTFFHARDVDDFYDFIEARILETDRKWFFLVCLDQCRIMPEAWVQYARRGKALNNAASLGSVRYAAGSETEADIRLRAQSQEFRPNIRNTREEALDRIAEMRAEAQTS